MSNLSTTASRQEFDFWEFVSCAKCYLPFIKDPGASSAVPFWLTECGHVICNSHLNADQSCAVCGDRGIQLMPLQQEMEAPMADWFRSAPLYLDAVAFTTRFQINTLASLVRHYKAKYVQYRPLLDRVKDQHAETKKLKKIIDDLRRENERLQDHLQHNSGMPQDLSNDNRKRRRLDVDRYVTQAGMSSSPRSILTPVGPDRLTLPPGHQQPSFNAHQVPQAGHVSMLKQSSDSHLQPNNRPGSSRFAEQYAYAPPQTPQSHAIPVLSHAQSAPTLRAQARGDQSRAQVGQSSAHMMPPPLPNMRDSRQTSHGHNPAQHDPGEHRHRTTNHSAQMPPPPTPQLGMSAGQLQQQQRGSFRPPSTPLPVSAARSSTSQRFVSQTPSRSIPPGMSNRFFQQNMQSQRLQPSGGSQRFSGALTTVSGSGAIHASTSGGDQRVPFVPGSFS